jgi:peptidoglycan/LPS O-acetylase OafA/YrhL
MLVQRFHLGIPERAARYALLIAPVLVLSVDLMTTRAMPKLLMHAFGFGALVLWAVLAERRHALDVRNPFATLGDWSYGLYLVHLSVISGLLALGMAAALPPIVSFVLLVLVALFVGSAFGAIELTLYRWWLRIAGLRRPHHGGLARGAPAG